jgi:hypothetical protein
VITYKLVNGSNYALQLLDGVPTGVQVHITLNADYLAWLAAGHTPAPAD